MHIDSVTLKTSFDGLKSAVDLIRSILGLAREAKDALPDGGKKEAISVSLSEAERQLRFVEAQIVQSLGYRLCQCTFPPQIMLSIGYHSKRGEERFECPRCKKKEPSNHYFAQLDRVDEYNAGLVDDLERSRL